MRMAVVEVWGSRGHDVVALDGARCSVGTSADAEIVIVDDPAVSRVHAVLETIAGSWCIRDLGAKNGTFVNGDRLFAERVLRDGDEVVLGRTRLVFRDRRTAAQPATQGLAAPPQLTPREREVLVELCRPLLSGNVFTQPTSVHDIAQRLYVADAAIKQHLGHLYDKFGILDDTDGPRRVRLANEAIQRGAVRLADLRDDAHDSEP
jgi:pSer/pThr/pTyr-binding forkhead associated (FHA) protein